MKRNKLVLFYNLESSFFFDEKYWVTTLAEKSLGGGENFH